METLTKSSIGLSAISEEILKSKVVFSYPEFAEQLNVNPGRMERLNAMDDILSKGTKEQLEQLSHELYGDKEAIAKTIKKQLEAGRWCGVDVKIKL